MRKKFFFIILFLAIVINFIFHSVSHAAIPVPLRIDQGETNNEAKSDSSVFQGQSNEILSILKDPEKLDQLINILENYKKDRSISKDKTNKHSPLTEEQVKKEKVETPYIIFIDNIMGSIKENVKEAVIYIKTYTTTWEIKKDFQEIHYASPKLIIIPVGLVLSIIMYLILEHAFIYLRLLSVKSLPFLNNRQEIENEPFSFSFLFKTIIYKTYSLLKIIVPPLLSFFVVTIIINIVKFYNEDISYLLGILVFFRILYLLAVHFTIIGELNRYKVFHKDIILLAIFFVIFSFIDVLLTNVYIGTKSTDNIFMRLNLLGFSTVILIQIFIMIGKTFSILAESNESPINWVPKKIYYIVILTISLLVCFVAIFSDNFITAQYAIKNVFYTLFNIVLYYAIAKILVQNILVKGNAFLVDNTNKLIATSHDFASIYKILKLDSLISKLAIALYVVVSYYFIISMDDVWGIEVFRNFVRTLISYRIIAAIITSAYLIVVMIVIYVFLTITVQILINKLAEDKLYDQVRKYLSLYIILRSPYILLSVLVIAWGILLAFDISIPTVLASTGIATVALAVGAKNSIQNFINSIVCLLEDSFSLGDVIDVVGKTGTVIGISLVYLKIRDTEGKRVMIPFNSIGVITNYSKDFSYAFIEVTLPSTMELSQVTAILDNLINTIKEQKPYSSYILGKLQTIGTIALSGASATFRYRLKTLAGRQDEVKYKIIEKLQQEMAAQGEIPASTNIRA